MTYGTIDKAYRIERYLHKWRNRVERKEEIRHPRFYITWRTNDVTAITGRMLETAKLLKDSEVDTRQPVQQNYVDDVMIMKTEYALINDTYLLTYCMVQSPS